MIIEMKVPSPGESISEVEIARWLKKDGDYVFKDEELCEIDSDKATLTINAEASGQLKILLSGNNRSVKVGDLICQIDTSAKAPETLSAPNPKTESQPLTTQAPTTNTAPQTTYATGTPSVAAKKIMEENNITPQQISGTGKDGRITKNDVLQALAFGFPAAEQILQKHNSGERTVKREKLSVLRRKISERLVAVKNETAMLTTFNEIDMLNVIELRKKYKDKFAEKHGIGLGFMSFFTKAVTEALKIYPAVNAMIDGDEIVYHNYADIGVAVSSPKGLMVPIIRNAEMMSLADIERQIKILADKARTGKITIEEMTGGTFTITNGGVFGSLMSTPIINPPQSAILGMHNIVERPVAVNGKVEIRPMMYVALSYDHRIIDGKESVGFLVKVKEMIENPLKIMFGGKALEEILLDI